MATDRQLGVELARLINNYAQARLDVNYFRGKVVGWEWESLEHRVAITKKDLQHFLFVNFNIPLEL